MRSTPLLANLLVASAAFLALHTAQSAIAQRIYLSGNEPVPGVAGATIGTPKLLCVAGELKHVLIVNAGPLPSGGTARALLVVDDCHRRLLAKEGDSVPGLAGVSFGLPFDAHIAADGCVTFISALRQAGSAAGLAVFREEASGALTLLQRTGDEVAPGQTVSGFSRGIVGANDASTLWGITLAGGSSGEFAYYAAGASGSATQVFRSLRQAPGFAPGALINGTDFAAAPRIALGGVVGAKISTTSSSGSLGILYGPPSALTCTVRQGALLPDIANNGITSIGAWTMGEGGTLAVALRANTSGGQQEFVYAGVPAADGGWGTMRQLARRGAAIPGMANATFGELGPANFPPGVYVGPSGDVVVGTLPNFNPPMPPTPGYTLVWYPAASRGSTPRVIASSGTTIGGVSGASIVPSEVFVDSTGGVTFRITSSAGTRLARWSAARDIRLSWMGVASSVQLTAFGGNEFASSTQMNVFSDLGFAATSFRGATSSDDAVVSVSFEGQCGSIDYDGDGLFPEDGDFVCYMAILAGGLCREPGPCGVRPQDFDNDSAFPEDEDLILLLQVMAGQPCDG